MNTFELRSGASRTLATFVRDKALRNGDRPALHADGRWRSYGELDRDSDRLAAGLRGLGLAPGDRICGLMANGHAAVDAWFAIAKCGAVDVPINTGNRGESLRYILKECEPSIVLCDAGQMESLTAVLPRSVRHVVVNGGPAEPAGAARAAGVTVWPMEQLYLDAAPSVSERHWRDPSVILYTSGTTGRSKGVLLSHEANLSLARHTVWMMGYGADDVLLTVFPLFHVNARYTSVLAAMESDARVVLERTFSARRFWDICRAHGVTAFNYQGALLTILWKQEPTERDTDHRVRIAMGAPCPREIWLPFEHRFGVRLVEVYGTTEVPIVTQNRLADRRVGACGKPTGQYEVRVVDEHGTPVPTREIGEIVVRPTRPSTIIGEYFRNERATVEAFRDLWFHTGDRGYFDEEGFLYFSDRKKDSIRRRGENVSSWEVERCVESIPGVLGCAAYGVASPLSEEEVMVAVVLKSGHSVPPEEIVAQCAANLPPFAVPAYIRFVDAFPVTATERVEKYRLREDGVTADTWTNPAAVRQNPPETP